MAGKMNVMKLLQEMRGLDFANRRPQSKLPALPMAPLRLQPTRLAPPRRRRLIRIAAASPLDFPQPVKIVHLKGKPSTAPETQVP
jgi:hypothetical protein